ncbi:hypothetical protein [Paenibacillus mucilaginosus]|uniref:hypothetical protein n=1 Tax=Paenibacillus mucilaginosus TaxID=61624 RepID=UPI003D261066
MEASGGCGSTHELTEDEKAAGEVVQAAGYRITSYLGEVHRYILDRSMLYGSTESIPYQQAWGVQKVEP